MSSSAAAAASSAGDGHSRERRRSRSPAASSRRREERSRSRSRSRSRDRPRERSDKHDKREHKHSKRASRSRSREPDRDRSSKHDKDRERERDERRREKKAEKQSTRELERALKKAQKALKHGSDPSAVAGLDPQLLDQLLAEQAAKKAAARADADRSSRSAKDSKKRSTKRRDASSDSDDAASSSDSSVDDRVGASPLLSDGVTPRLFKSDYFQRSTEFRVWLHETRQKHLDATSAKAARTYFGLFVGEWNAQKLPAKYYSGMDSAALQAASLTQHKWKIRLTEAERLKLDSTRDDIDTATNHHSYAQEFQGRPADPSLLKQNTPAAIAQRQAQSGGSSSAAAASASASSRGAESTLEREERLRREKVANKRHSANVAVVLEELAPKATGREAQLEKRAAKGSYAHVDRDAGGMEAVSDRDLMGSGGSSEYAALLTKQRQQQAGKQNEASAKLSEHQQREREKMKKLLGSLGLQDKYPMQ